DGSSLHPRESTTAKKLLALTEGPLVVDDQPSFLFRDNCWGQGNHAGTRTTILDHPEKFAIFSLLMELAVREIPGARIENLTGLALSIAILTMTIEAGAFPLKQCLSFGNAFRGRSNRILVGLRVGNLIRRNTGLKRVTLFGSDNQNR